MNTKNTTDCMLPLKSEAIHGRRLVSSVPGFQETGNRFSVNLLVTDALIRDLLGVGRGVSYEVSDS